MNLTPKQESRSFRLLQIAGFGLLAFSAVDFIQLMIPLRLMNPEWEFQFIGALAERVALPLLGIVLIFCGEPPAPGSIEAMVLKGVSSLSLAVAVGFLLLLPLGIFDTARLRRNLDAQLATQASQIEQQQSRLRELRTRLTEARSAVEIASALMGQNIPTSALDYSNPGKLKAWLLSELTQTEDRLVTKAETDRTDALRTLYKNSVKWNLIAVLAGGLFFHLWRRTRQPASQPIDRVGSLRLAGGALLVLAAFDLVHLFVPIRVTSAAWQFHLLSGSVDRLPLLLLGMVLYFFGERNARGPRGMTLVKVMSYLSLALAVWFLLLLPLGVYSARELRRDIRREAAFQMARFRDYLGKPADITRTDAAALSSLGAQSAKDEPVGPRAETQETLGARIAAASSEKHLALNKSVAKAMIGGLFAIALFFLIYRRTQWAWREESDW